MYDINWLLFVFILIITSIIFSLFYFREKKTNRKFLYIFITVSIFIYSGIGMSYNDIEDEYIYKYFIFLFCLLLTISIVFKFRDKKQNLLNKIEDFNNIVDYELSRYCGVYNLLSIGFILTYFIYLLVPVVRISLLWNPPLPSIVGILDKRDLLSQIPILSVADTINTLLLPFFLIKIYILINKNKGKKIKATILIIIWLYLDYLRLEYWGRNDMTRYSIFLLLVIFAFKKGKIIFKKRHIIFTAFCLFITIPFFVWYEFFRLGVSAYEISFSDSLLRFLRSEAYYPKYYSQIEKFSGVIKPINYILWIVFLPFPSVIWASKPSLAINTIFSELLLGISRGMRGYNVLLPSLLGESFMVWGMHFYWIHAIIIGFLIAVIIAFYENSKLLYINNLFFIIQILVIGRGGSQSYLGLLINGTIPILLWIILINMNQKYRK